MDPALRNPRLYAQLLRRVYDIGLIEYLESCICSTGVIFAHKKNGSPRLILDGDVFYNSKMLCDCLTLPAILGFVEICGLTTSVHLRVISVQAEYLYDLSFHGRQHSRVAGAALGSHC